MTKKYPELIYRKCILFHQDNQEGMFLWWPGKNGYSLIGKFWFIHHISQTLQFQISFFFFFFSFCGLYKILLMEKMSVPWNTIKSTWNGILFKKIKHLGKMELWIAWKMAEGSGTKWWINSLLMFLVKMKNMFYFYFKNEGTFWPTQYK